MNPAFFIFRVFDVAYFVPGVVAMASLVEFARWWATVEGTGSGSPSCLYLVKLTESSSAASGILLVVGTYLLGLACHGAGRLLRRIGIVKRPCTNPHSGSEFFPVLVTADPSLVQYFWYMRTVCLNLIPALLLATIVACVVVNVFFFVRCLIFVFGFLPICMAYFFVRCLIFVFGFLPICMAYYLFRDYLLSYEAARKCSKSSKSNPRRPNR